MVCRHRITEYRKGLGAMNWFDGSNGLGDPF